MAHSIFPLGSPQESIRKWRELGTKSVQKPHSGAFSIGEKSNYSIVSSTTLFKVELESRCQFPMAHSVFPLGSQGKPLCMQNSLSGYLQSGLLDGRQLCK